MSGTTRGRWEPIDEQEATPSPETGEPTPVPDPELNAPSAPDSGEPADKPGPELGTDTPAVLGAKRRSPVRRGIGVVVVLAVIGAVSGVLVAAFAPPEYTATAQVLVRSRDYAAVVLGAPAAPNQESPQRVLAAQVLAAQSPQFTDEVARRSNIDGREAASHLTVTASPDANVLVFSARSGDPKRAATIADKAAELEVSTYRDQLVRGLGDPSANNGLGGLASGMGIEAQRTFAQAESFEAISPSAQVIAQSGQAQGGPIPKVSAAVAGALAGAVVALLLLVSEHLWRERTAHLSSPSANR